MAELFPSGPWIGFYTYASPQDKHRQDFQLSFENGRMDGSGSDDIGFFILRGTYNEDSLEAKWLKTYPGSHDVDYRGFREGKGIYGQWTIGGSSGGFMIWPKGKGDGMSESVGETVEEPVGVKRT